MAVVFDWEALKPTISQILTEAINSCPPDINPFVASPISLRSINLGAQPPLIAITKILALSEEKKEAQFVVRYSGDAEIEVMLDLNVNFAGFYDQNLQTSRFMNHIYTDPPFLIRTRLLISEIKLYLKVTVSVTDELTVKIDGRPSISMNIDSNLGKLGPIFEGALNRITGMIHKMYSSLPPVIKIAEIPKLGF